MQALTTLPQVSFLGVPVATQPEQIRARFAFLGIPYGEPYGDPVDSPSADAPSAVRAATLPFCGEFDHYDFDLEGPLAADGSLSLVDCGDVVPDPDSVSVTTERAKACVRRIVSAGAVPLVVGGDHAIPPLVVAGLDLKHELNILHIDAHLDFRDEVNGVRGGYSSPIRRLRELSCVRDVIQVGLRGPGSARSEEHEAAVAAGNVLITADRVHAEGVGVVLDQLRDGARYYITVDVDGFDPSCTPGAGWPAPGGLFFHQVAAIIRAAVTRGRLAGIDFCEFVPRLDVNGLTALVVARLLMNVIGLSPERRCA